jgi:hypothetical protein
MNRGGGGERQHLFFNAFLMLAQEWRSCMAAVRLPRFSPTSCPTSMQFFFQILKI